MRQLGRLAMTPAAFFALAFLAVAGTVSPARVDVTVSPVSCPAGRATVRLSARNGLDRGAAYGVYRDGRAVREGTIGSEGGRTVAVRVEPGRTARISVKVDGQSTVERTVDSPCRRRRSRPANAGGLPARAGGRSSPDGTAARPGESPEDSRPSPSGSRRPGSRRPPPTPRSSPGPRKTGATGTDAAGTDAAGSPGTGAEASAVTGSSTGLPGWALTAGVVALAGGLIWFGAIWPRRLPREPVNPDRSPYGPRRYPGLKI
ncbi:hypothetical protein [Streptosporangium sp. NPDC051022]|uniref:hypothetical protein n=1 Tax=Streptosporangium sp. NPDC051022 TaxID=3155752 RepID=UPI003413EB4C